MPISIDESSILRDIVAVSEIFSHLDADNAVSEAILITNMFSKWMRYFLWSMGNSWHDNSSVRKNKKGFWDVGLHR